jgi:hypothetical protein
MLFLRFSAVGGQSLYKAAVRGLLFKQRRSAGSQLSSFLAYRKTDLEHLQLAIRSEVPG